MAKNKFSLDFDGFLDMARKMDELGQGYLKKATENALIASKDHANESVSNAMASSKFSFQKGVGRSIGKSKESLEKVSSKPVKWEGTECVAYVGIDLGEAPEAMILAYGTPHIKGDSNLKNAIKVKGKYAKERSLIQREEFNKVMEEAFRNG